MIDGRKAFEEKPGLGDRDAPALPRMRAYGRGGHILQWSQLERSRQ